MPIESFNICSRPMRLRGLISPFERRFERRFFCGQVDVSDAASARLVRDRRGAVGRFTDPANPNFVAGYASVFGSPSLLLREHGEEFREIIAAGAFSESLTEREPLLLLAHEAKNLLARSPDSLDAREDETGLAFSADLSGSELGRQTAARVKAGDLRGVSIGFIVPEGGDRWEQPDGLKTPLLRTINRLELYEISIVERPAYRAPHVRDDRTAVGQITSLSPRTIVGLGLYSRHFKP